MAAKKKVAKKKTAKWTPNNRYVGKGNEMKAQAGDVLGKALGTAKALATGHGNKTPKVVKAAKQMKAHLKARKKKP